MVVIVYPPPKISMTSNDVITQLKEQLCKAKADKTRFDAEAKAETECKVAEEKQSPKRK